MFEKQRRSDLATFLKRIRFPNLFVMIGTITFGIALFAYALLGIYSRYYADDYCSTSLYLHFGFIKSQYVIYTSWLNRYSVTLLINISELFGRQAIRMLPAIIIISLVAASSWSSWQLAKRIGLTLSKWEVFLLAESIIFFSVLALPEQFEVLYWRIGAATNTVPLVFMILLIGLILNRSGKPDASKVGDIWGLIACGFLCFIAGGFSETYLTLQLGIIGLALLGLYLFINSASRRRWINLLLAALVGSILAFVVVVLSPGNAVRQASLPPHPDIFNLVESSFFNAFIFIYSSIHDNVFLFLIGFFIPLLMIYAFSVKRPDWPGFQISTLIQIFFILPVIVFFLIVCTMAPSAYFQASFPEGRTLTDPQFIITTSVAIEGIVLGLLLVTSSKNAKNTQPAYFQIFIVLLFLTLSLYPLYDARKTFSAMPTYQSRAALWDARDAKIRSDQKAGITNIQVQEFDSIGLIMEIGPDPQNWVNICAATYYNVSTIIGKP